MILGVRHTGIVVRDLERMRFFYKSLGFVEENSNIETGNFIEQVTGIDGLTLEWAKLRSPDGCLIELLNYNDHSEVKEIENSSSNKLGISHVAFTVDNIDIICSKILEAGGSLVNPPALSPDGKVRVAYCHDLEGVLLELVELQD